MLAGGHGCASADGDDRRHGALGNLCSRPTQKLHDSSMNYLLLAIRHCVTKYRWSIIGSLICSLLVGVLWGANIGAVYPFAEVIFKGQSLHEWAQTETANCKEKIAEVQADIADFDQQIAAAQDPSKISKLKSSRDFADTELKGWESKLGNVEKSKPYIDAYAPHGPFNTLLALVAFLLIGTVLKGIFLSLSMMLVARATQLTTLDLKQQLFKKLLDVRLGKTHISTGDSTSRMNGDVASIGGSLEILFGKTVREPIKMIACLAGAAYINWRLLILSLLIAPAAAFVLYRLARTIKNLNLSQIMINARITGFFIQIMHGYYVVKAYGTEEYEQARFEAKSRQAYWEQVKIRFFNSMVRVNNEVLGLGMVCLSLIAGGYLVLNQETHIFGIPLADKPMELGSILAFYALLVGCTDPLRKLGDVFGAIQAGIASAELVYPLLQMEMPIEDPKDPVPMSSVGRDITLKDVEFCYTENTPVLKKLNLNITHGEAIAIVGPNGCGKSTIINLLMRFYDPDSGQVLLGGTDLRKFAQHDLRSKIALVTQSTVLFDESIRENIRYGSMDATDEQVLEASKLAYVDQFVQTHMSNGYDTMCGDRGTSLSGGQRQRISIARALLRNPDIIIMDEATSQIDMESERLIHDSLKNCIAGRTAILITHRASTLKLASRIVVMNHGQIEATGTHEQLIETSKTYRRLYVEDDSEAATNRQSKKSAA